MRCIYTFVFAVFLSLYTGCQHSSSEMLSESTGSDGFYNKASYDWGKTWEAPVCEDDDKEAFEWRKRFDPKMREGRLLD